MSRAISLFLLVISALTTAACGGGHGNATTPVDTTPARGQLLTSPPQKLASYSPTDLAGLLAGSDAGKELLSLAYTPKCGLDVYQLEYETVGGKGEPASASAALMIPTGADSGCGGPLPIVLYGHGTQTNRNYNIANIADSGNAEGLILAAVFASRGYLVVAPNYAGYDSSDLSYHPYINADQQSKDMIDALAGARSALGAGVAAGVSDNAKLFITGYSQGGFVAMATHRAIEAAGGTVTAAAPMSGPYALAAFGDAIFMGEVTLSAAVNITLLVTSYQHAYGNVYHSAGELFEAQYAGSIDALLPSTTNINELYSQGKLPQSAVFSTTPPAPEFASITPATTPAALAPFFAVGFGAGNLVTNDYRLSYLRDAQATPDGGFPNVTTGVPAPSSVLGFRQDLITNDLRNWMPKAPTLLCAGDQDPTVLYLNTQLMQQYWTANPPSGTVTVLDVDAPAGSGDPYANLKAAFAAAKDIVAAAAVAGGASDGGASAVGQAYHAKLVPPVCVSAVKSFFDGY